MSLFTRPASLKNFHSPSLAIAWKILAYPWVIFWFTGFLVGLVKMKKNPAFAFLVVMILYYTTATIGATMWGASARFRIPLMPYIAIISAFGWNILRKPSSP